MDTVSDAPKIMILGGATGLLGQAVAYAASIGGYDVVTAGRSDVNILDSDQLSAFVDRHQPDIICNAVAYTQVDKAEDEEEQAMLLNRVFPCLLGRVVKSRSRIHLVHYSTDFVFDGRKNGPYTETDPTAPESVYGRSKLEGENALLGLQIEKLSIIRTAWLFGPGKKNFVSTILGLCPEGKPLRVVHDQIGSPTYTRDLAAYTLRLVEAGGTGIFHLANSGKASWCELASEAVRLAQAECGVSPITSAEWPQQAKRPAYSVLDTSRFTELTGITPRPWPQALAEYIYSTQPN